MDCSFHLVLKGMPGNPGLMAGRQNVRIPLY